MLSGFFFPPLWNNFKLYCQDSRSLVHKNQQWLVSYLQTPFPFWCISLYTIMTEEDQQRVAKWTDTTQCCPLSTGLSLYPFQISCFLSNVCSSKVSHDFFPGSVQESTMCLFLAKYTPTSLLQQKYTLIRQLPEKHHKSQPSLQKSKIPTLEAFMWHLRNVDFQIPFTELQGVNVSILEYRIYIHTVVFSQIYPLGIFLSLCLCPCLCLYPPYFSVSLYLSVFQFAFV